MAVCHPYALRSGCEPRHRRHNRKPASRWRQFVSREGVNVEFAVRPTAVRKDRSRSAGDWADITFRVTDASTGEPIKGRYPAAWMDLGEAWEAMGGRPMSLQGPRRNLPAGHRRRAADDRPQQSFPARAEPRPVNLGDRSGDRHHGHHQPVCPDQPQPARAPTGCSTTTTNSCSSPCRSPARSRWSIRRLSR